MKRDVTELKKLFLEVLQNPSAAIQNPAFINEVKELQPHHESPSQPGLVVHNAPKGQPVPIAMGRQDGIDEHIEVEESLNIMDKEKELIIKALKKHKGKRKDAAMDLGISERTLYRKLKEYYIEE